MRPRFSGNHEAVHRDINLAEDLVKEFRCRSFQRADTEEQKESLWSARKQALWASLACRPEGTQMWSTDVAVPLSRMAELISNIRVLFPGLSSRLDLTGGR